MLKPLTRKELIRKFRTLGYSGPFSGGKHQFMSQEKFAFQIHILVTLTSASLEKLSVRQVFPQTIGKKHNCRVFLCVP